MTELLRPCAHCGCSDPVAAVELTRTKGAVESVTCEALITSPIGRYNLRTCWFSEPGSSFRANDLGHAPRQRLKAEIKTSPLSVVCTISHSGLSKAGDILCELCGRTFCSFFGMPMRMLS
jgi:hypothetical protein